MKNLLPLFSLLIVFSADLSGQDNYALSEGFRTKEIVRFEFPADADQWPGSVQNAKLNVKSKNAVLDSEGRSGGYWLKSLNIDQSRDYEVEVSFSTGLFQSEGNGGFIFGSNGRRYLFFEAD